jgi:hypothetical protein
MCIEGYLEGKAYWEMIKVTFDMVSERVVE